MGLSCGVYPMKKITLLSLAHFLTLAFVGRESTGAKKEKSEDDGEYVYVTNSRIPRKVRKGSTYDHDAGSSPMGTVSGAKARDYIGAAGSSNTSSGNN